MHTVYITLRKEYGSISYLIKSSNAVTIDVFLNVACMILTQNTEKCIHEQSGYKRPRRALAEIGSVGRGVWLNIMLMEAFANVQGIPSKKHSPFLDYWHRYIYIYIYIYASEKRLIIGLGNGLLFWNLTDILEALLPSCPSNYTTIWLF